MGWSVRNGRAAMLLAAGLCLCVYVELPPAEREGRYADAATAADSMLAGDAPDAARQALLSHLMWVEPDRVVRRLGDLGYSIELNERPRDGHWFLPAELDYHGGFASVGRRLIVVSQEIRAAGGGYWFPNRQLDEAIDHEIGHALDADVTGSAASAFIAAWNQDFKEIPVDLTTSYKPNGRFDPFRYFVYSDGSGRVRAQQETFAEAYVVLLKGEHSGSAAAFRRWFPRTLATERRILESRYGPLFPAS